MYSVGECTFSEVDAYCGLFVSDECISNVTGAGGQVVSNGYPDQYRRNELCEWTIRGGKDKTIVLNFQNFYLEGHPGMPHSWIFDYILLNQLCAFRA